MRRDHLVQLAVFSLLAAGCDAEVRPDTDAGVRADAGTPEGVLVTRVESGNTGASGETSVTVHVEAERSFMVVATSETNARLAVLAIDDPSGARILQWEDWYDTPYTITNAFYADVTAAVINWPIRAEDPALVPGDYVVHLGSYRTDEVTARPDIPIEITTLLSSDHDLDRGVVRVAVLYADGLAADPDLVLATEAAVAHWEEVWAGAGMGLEVRYVETSIDPALPYPSPMAGDVLIAASSLTADGEVALVIGDTVDGDTSTYGVAGQIPGPLVTSPLSAIVVGWLAHAGADGTFSADDIRLYGEVFAHEVGHYVGLFHPVEDGYDAWDALSDTPECAGQAECEEVLGTNLMFPYSICDAGVCVSTTILSAGQRGVMQRYTGTL